ncbi:Diacylglycerol pyrophosphate phosphatase 1 [Balamuthia mandrillaris]
MWNTSSLGEELTPSARSRRSSRGGGGEVTDYSPWYRRHQNRFPLLGRTAPDYCWWDRSYLYDWGALVFVALVESILTNFVIEPYKRFEPKDDPSLSYPLHKSIVPTWLLMLWSFLVPLTIFAVYQLLVRRSRHDLHHACLGLFTALTLTLFLTDFLKLCAGRLRPNWLALEGDSESSFQDGRKSFPSGHSSLSFASMVFLSLYLCGKLGVFRKTDGAVWKLMLGFLPLLAACFIGISRTRDYHHHFSDVLAGAVIGIIFGCVGYSLHFHPLSGKWSHLPKTREKEGALRPILYSGIIQPQLPLHSSPLREPLNSSPETSPVAPTTNEPVELTTEFGDDDDDLV